jgi:manganese/zinc/iron transport system permease protein
MIFQIFLIAITVALACALPGVFLVLRGNTMLSDAITHSVLLGIVLAFFIVEDLNSPFLLIGATLVGVLVVWIIEALQRSKLMPDDAAIGVVFPLFFSLGIILITRYAGDIHLDTDSVLMGELAFSPIRRLEIFGVDIGPASFWTMFIILIINALFVAFFYKELKVSTFDPEFSQSQGFSPTLIHYILMTLVSLTAVGAYDAVGSILVVGFMVGPALSGYLLTNDLKKMIGYALAFAVLNSVVGVSLGFVFDISLAGMIATVTGITTFLVYLFSPLKGYIVSRRAHRKKKKRFTRWLENNME